MRDDFDRARLIHIDLDVVHNRSCIIHRAYNHRRALLIKSKRHGSLDTDRRAQLDLVVDDIRTQKHSVHRVDVLKRHALGAILLLAREDPLQIKSARASRLLLTQDVAILALVQCKERRLPGPLVGKERLNVAVKRRQLGLVEARHLYKEASHEDPFSSHGVCLLQCFQKRTLEQENPRKTQTRLRAPLVVILDGTENWIKALALQEIFEKSPEGTAFARQFFLGSRGKLKVSTRTYTRAHRVQKGTNVLLQHHILILYDRSLFKDVIIKADSRAAFTHGDVNFFAAQFCDEILRVLIAALHQPSHLEKRWFALGKHLMDDRQHCKNGRMNSDKTIKSSFIFNLRLSQETWERLLGTHLLCKIFEVFLCEDIFSV